jgi:ABC-type lipoprotein release transport system permease subunit
MPLLLRLGYRNLWRNSRRTLLAMAAMAIAAAFLVFLLGMIDGILDDAITSTTGLYFGDAKVAAPGYLDSRDTTLTLAETAKPRFLSEDPAVQGAAGRVRGFALLSTGTKEGEESQPAEILGVDPREEEAVSHLIDHVIAGQVLPDSRSKGILLGQELARRLGAKVGSELVAMGQGADGSVASDIFQVVGLIGTGDVTQDSMLAIVGRHELQSMLGLEGRVHEWTVALKAPRSAPDWAMAAQKRDPSVEVASWFRFIPQLADTLKIMGAYEYIIGGIFYVAALMLFFNTMTMALMERVREFAVMGAIGIKRWRLWRLMVLEGGLMSAMAGLVGGLVGLGASLWFHAHPIDLSGSMSAMQGSGYTMKPLLRTSPAWGNVLVPTLVMMAMGAVIAAMPAWRICRRRPVEALREV